MAGSQARNDKVPCTGCHHVFNRRADMERHYELKHNARRYHCGYPGCTYSAGRSYTRNAHREKKHKDFYNFELQLASDADNEQSDVHQNNQIFIDDTLGHSTASDSPTGVLKTTRYASSAPMITSSTQYGSSASGNSGQDGFTESWSNINGYGGPSYQPDERQLASYNHPERDAFEVAENRIAEEEATGVYQYSHTDDYDYGQWDAPTDRYSR